MMAACSLELRLVLRDGGLRLAFLALLAMLLFSYAWGRNGDDAERATLQSAARLVQQEWTSQPPANPHEAAHQGILVYRPTGPLQTLEPGVSPYQGTTLFLDAHKRRQATLSAASVRTADARYTATRFSPLFQIAGGFLSLVLGYMIGAREARRGMSLLLRGTGARGASLVVAKTAVALGFISLAALPALVWAGLELGGARFWLLAGALLVHQFILAALGVATGLLTGRARFGLAVTAIGWAIGVIIMPRIADIGAELAYPLTQRALVAGIEKDFTFGPDGHGASEANAEVERAILARYGVTRREDAPVNVDALLMQADEDYRARVYQKHLLEADTIRRHQDRVRGVAWLFAPTSAMLDLSTRLAGVDPVAQQHFETTAEAFRLSLVKRLNLHMAEYSNTGDWSWKADDRFFSSFTAFRPQARTVAQDLKGAWGPAAMLAFWGVLAVLALVLAARRFDANDA